MKKQTQTRLPFFGLPKIVRFLRPYRREVFCLVFFAVLGGVVDTVLPLFQQYAITNFVAQETTAGIPLFILFYVLVLGFGVLCNTVSSYSCCAVEMYTARDMRGVCFNHLQTLTASYYNTHAVGYIHSRLMSDTGRISGVLSWTVLDILFCGIYVVGALVNMFLLRPSLAVWVLLLLPVATVIGLFFKKKMTAVFHRVRENNSIVTGKLNEGITGAATVKSLAVEGRMTERFKDASGALYRTSMHMARLRSLFFSFFSLVASVALSMMLYLGGVIAMQDVLFIGILATFLTYVQEMVDRLTGLVSSVSGLVNAGVNIERFTALLETETEVQDRPEVREKYGDVFAPKKENWEKMEGEVRFEDVTFRYPDGGENVLEHFSLDIPAGSVCAIVGETGAGKSTLVNLVCRFFEPTAGRVLIDGHDVRDRGLCWLHANTGYVLQTPHLFSGSVRENLLYGNPDAAEDTLWHALDLVCATDVVQRLGGLDADVGEGGDRLSTGEKQLLSFARALVADPRLFILDEATSSIDTVTEQKLQTAIETVMRGRTSLVIAHRLSTIRNADIILVVVDGKIVERGTHAQLMQAQGAYYQLVLQQYRGEASAKALA